MNILLINPDWGLSPGGLYSRIRPAIPPAGLAYIAAYLRENGFSVRIIDQYSSHISDEEIIKTVKGYKPRIVGFSCITVAMEKAEAIASLIKKYDAAIFTVMGNVHPTALPEETLSKGLIDYVVRGEGEITMLELSKAIRDAGDTNNIQGISYIKDGEYIHNPDRPLVKDLDSFPYPAWDLLDTRLYKIGVSFFEGKELMLPVFASRGCPGDCLFCAHSTVFPRVRRRSMRKVVDEMESFYKKINVVNFGISDSCFPMTRRDGEEFALEMARRGLHKKIGWFADARADMVDAPLLKKLRASGAKSIFFGFESGNQSVLNVAKKNILLGDARKAVSAAKEAGIRTSGFFMLGLPGDTPESCMDTIKFAKKIDPDIAIFQITMPYPGSELFYSIKNYRNIGTEYKLFSAWRNFVSEDMKPAYIPEGLSVKKLHSLQRRAFMEFYLRPGKMLRNILKGIFPLRYIPAGFVIFINMVFQGIKSINTAE